MKTAELVQHLSKGIESAVRSHHFCVSGVLAKIDPGIDVVGLGSVKLPLKPTGAKRLMAECVQAPYGKGTQTLVNTNVRNAFELAPKRFALTIRSGNKPFSNCCQRSRNPLACRLTAWRRGFTNYCSTVREASFCLIGTAKKAIAWWEVLSSLCHSVQRRKANGAAPK